MPHWHRKARVCVVCDAGYQPSYHEQRTCGRACGVILRQGPLTSKVVWRHCRYCLSWRTTKATPCGCGEGPKSCRVFVTECQSCSRWFCSPYTVSTCSTACAEGKAKQDKRLHKDRRRALERDAFVANVYRAKVYERDGWRCHLCGKPTKRDAVVPDPMAPTLDHVVPLACGGTHEPSNCRTAHYLCNSRKGARGGGEQLLLIG